jgi:uncharacterized membrane protein YccC
MATEKQLQANRANARKSTGVQTEYGKEVSSRNALKYGLHSQMLVLPDENPEEFQLLCSDLQEYFQTVGIVEKELVNRMAHLFWRLQRTNRIEASILTQNYLQEKAWRAEEKAEAFVQTSEPTFEELCSELGGTSETVINKQEYTKAKQEAQEAHNQMNRESTIIGEAFLRDVKADALTKLSRYETTLQRNLSRTLHDFLQLQAARKGIAGAPPDAAAIDVTVTKSRVRERLT